MPRFIAAATPTAMVRHIPGGQLEDLPLDQARELLAAGVVELAGAFPESAMLAPAETAMLPAARVKRRGRQRD